MNFSSLKNIKIKIPLIKRGVSLSDKMFFAKYLALMLRAGIPLVKSLEFLAVQVGNKYFKEVISAVSKDIRGGIPFADCLSKYPRIFDDLFVNMARSGEMSGNLSEVLDLSAEELKESIDLRSKVKGALVYPIIVLCLTVAISGFIVFFVFPKILQIYQNLNIPMPITTAILIAVVKFSVAYARYIFGGLIGLILATTIFLRTKLGSRLWDKLVLNLPFIKNIIIKINIVHFTRTLSSLLKGGVSIAESLIVVSKVVSNILYRDSILNMAKSIREGKPLNEIIKLYPRIYPPIVDQMITIGEETGGLTPILKELASFYKEEVNRIISNLSKTIEPILLVTMGVIVGFIAIATVQLIYSSLSSGAI